ncbi:MAG TPA: GNAT family N-acetyltransferase [Saprospiraceae bacterium]|nr:GNAT family N-acetyltransferase [Saprospiraceae bacterium]HMP13961.1 GNAT family N-acetyltransferase [Saprospiraceae bacterium]
MEFQCLAFEQLNITQLYDIMALRQSVFVVEQNCPYLDADGKDPQGWHLMARATDGGLLAYARLLPAGVSYPEYPSIGRVVSAPQVRGQGAGRVLMQMAIQYCEQLFSNQPIKIGAQTYLLQFYQSFGFQSVGDIYIEDGIPHINMIRPAK